MGNYVCTHVVRKKVWICLFAVVTEGLFFVFFLDEIHLNCTAFTVNHWNRAWKCGQTCANLPFCLTEAKTLQGKEDGAPPRVSAAWVIQESYSQVKLWPFNGTYCEGVRWCLTRTYGFIGPGTLSVFPRAFAQWVNSSCFVDGRNTLRDARWVKTPPWSDKLQPTPRTCMLVISSDLPSAHVIQRFNRRMRFVFSSNHFHLNPCSLIAFLAKIKSRQNWIFQDRAVGAACQLCGFLRSSLMTLIDSSSTRSA